jgi:hypothetical protein
VSARKFVVGVLIAAGLIALVGGIATAKVKTKTKSTTIAGDSNGKVSAKCSRGSEAVAGGFTAPGFDPTFQDRAPLPFTSKRAGDRKWKTQGHNFGDNPAKLKSIAYCDTKEPNLRVESKTESVPAFTTGSATARCPQGSEAVSGGWASKNVVEDDEQFAYESRRKGDRKWKVSAFNQDITNAQPLVAYVYCNNDGPNLKAKSDKVNVPEGEKRTAKANCKHGEKAYSGGFKGQVNTDASGPFAFTSKRAGNDWQGKAAGNGNGTHRFKVYAYCK